MGRNYEFKSSALFHGTTHPFEVGEHVTPQGEEPYAFATPDLDYATDHAGKRETFDYSKATKSGKPEDHKAAENIEGRVYEVEPLADDAFQHSDNNDAIVSKTGFKVVKRVK